MFTTFAFRMLMTSVFPVSSLQADKLDSLLADTRHVSQNALQAANAYSDIVKAIDDAQAAAERAQDAGNLVSRKTNIQAYVIRHNATLL